MHINGLPPLPASAHIVEAEFFQRRPDLLNIRDSLLSACRMMLDNFQRGGMVYLCGNGGSFADALHIKSELAKSFERPRPLRDAHVRAALENTDIGRRLADALEEGLPVVVLGDSHGLRSAYANDRDPEFIYAQELNSFAAHIQPGILLALSTSGNAHNVLAAATLARARGLLVISLTGPDGGELAPLADIALRVPGESPAAIQENHLPLYHTLCRMVEAAIFST